MQLSSSPEESASDNNPKEVGVISGAALPPTVSESAEEGPFY